MKRFFMTAIVGLLLLVAAGAAFIYSGIYDVAATSRDSKLMRWVLHTTMERSLERRAAAIEVPATLSLSDPHLIRVGFEHYNEMCTTCHGAPGVEPGEARDGLNPRPPELAEHAKEMSPEELFWVIKNGVKMTGMPAWGPTHSDTKIWAMVAFLKTLPDLTPEQYRSMRAELAQAGGDDDHAAQPSTPQEANPGHHHGHTP